MSGASSGHRHWADAAAYDFSRTYVVNFLKRPLGMLVEDRGGVCTVVELQRDDDGRVGQAAAHGVMVNDAIVSLQGMDTRHLDFPKLTEHIRQAKMPFQIGFVRHQANLRTATPPFLMAQRYTNMSPLHHHHHQHALPLMGASPPVHDWAAKPPQYNNGMGHGGLPAHAPLIRPRPVMAQPNKAQAHKHSSLSSLPLPGSSNNGPPPLPKPHSSGSGSGRPKLSHQVAAMVARAAKRPMPPSEEDSIAGFLRQHKQRKPGGLPGVMAALQSHTRQEPKVRSAPLDDMLEELGRGAIQAFLNQPQTVPDEDEDEEEGGAGTKTAAKVEEDETLNEAALVRIKAHFMHVREALLRSRQASHDLYEYSRALLCRGEVMGVVEGRVMKLLQHRALDVRDKVQELRAGEGGATAGAPAGAAPAGGAAKAVGTLTAELGVRWNEVNEQRRAQLTHQRRILEPSSTELQTLVTDNIPKACRAVEASLQGRMEHLQRLFCGLADVLAPEDAGASGRKAETRSESTTAPGPSTPRPHLLDYHHHDRPDTPNTLTTTHGPYEHKKPKIGTDCQVTDSGVPAQWAPDPSLTILTTHLPFPKEGDETCRWKPPSDTAHMPTQAEIDELVSNFRPELQETVLWELYRRGWDVGSTLEGVKAMLMQGTLRKEFSTEPLSKAEAALFEKAMAESWKNFGKAVELLKGSKSHRSVVVHYYNNFKRSEAYKRLKPKSGGGIYR